MSNNTIAKFACDVNLGFGSSAVIEGAVYRISDCGGSEIFVVGSEADAEKLVRTLRDDDTELPGDPDDESDDRGLVAFWEHVCATCDHYDSAHAAALTALDSTEDEDVAVAVAQYLRDEGHDVIVTVGDTAEDWDVDSDGDPVCRTRTEITLSVDGSDVMRGASTGYYSRCCSGSERFSSWQDDDGPERDQDWRIIAAIATQVLDMDEGLLDGTAPDEPSKPKQDPTGEYVVLYHGWEQDWQMRGRYASRDDAERAARIADRQTTEANSPGAYGWEYEVAAVAEGGEIVVDGMRINICEQTDEH